MSLETLRISQDIPPKTVEASYNFPLDGGGRHLITDLIHTIDAKVMVEIGCFLGGSTRMWLESSPALIVVGIDTWEGEWHKLIEEYLTNSLFKRCFRFIEDTDAFITSVKTHGNLPSTLSNLKDFGDRFIPIVGRSPESLKLLRDHKIDPDIVYIDADKKAEDLYAVHELFPNAAICGDDWSWHEEEGFPMRRIVQRFAEEKGYQIEASWATWVIIKN